MNRIAESWVLIRALKYFYTRHRDIYYAKYYYGKGGGNGQFGEEKN